ncbi:hypothetical protein [Thermococcus sp.]
MWVIRLQLRRFAASKSAAFMIIGALLLGVAFLGTGSSTENNVRGYFFTLTMLFALFSTSLSSQIPRDAITLSKPVKRRRLLMEHLGAVLIPSTTALLAGSLMVGTKASPGDVFKGAVITTEYLLAFSAVGLLVGTILRGWAQGIVSVTAGFALLFLPMGLTLFGKTTSLWPFLLPTLGPFLTTVEYIPVIKGFLYAAASSAIYISAAIIVYGRSDVR